MRDLLTKILWLPFDIMQRVSQRFLTLGRSAYGSLFGNTKPAIKPPSSSPPPHLPSNSLDFDFETGKLSYALTENETGKIVNVNSIQALHSSVTPATTSSTSLIPIPIDIDDVEQGTMESLCENRSDTDIARDIHEDHLHVHDSTVHHTVMPPDNNEEYEDGERRVTNSQYTSRSTTAEVINETMSSYESSGSKRSEEIQKRKASRKQNEESGNSGSRDQAMKVEVGQGTCRFQSKKQKLSEDLQVAEEPSDSCQDIVSEQDKPKRKKRRSHKKNKKEQEEKQDISMRTFSPPNFFIAIQISNKEILDNVGRLQKNLTEKTLSPPWHGLRSTEIFQDAMVPVQKLHFTLHVVNLRIPEDLEKAQNALEESWREVYQEFLEDPMDMTIEGLGHFRNSVIFAQIKDEKHITRLEKLSDVLRRKFGELNIPGDPRPFKPHMTIAKISRSNKLHKKKIRSFPPEIWGGCEKTHFGIQRVNSVQLLCMAGEDKLTGYYRCFGQHYFHEECLGDSTNVPVESSSTKEISAIDNMQTEDIVTESVTETPLSPKRNTPSLHSLSNTIPSESCSK